MLTLFYLNKWDLNYSGSSLKRSAIRVLSEQVGFKRWLVKSNYELDIVLSEQVGFKQTVFHGSNFHFRKFYLNKWDLNFFHIQVQRFHA